MLSYSSSKSHNLSPPNFENCIDDSDVLVDIVSVVKEYISINDERERTRIERIAR